MKSSKLLLETVVCSARRGVDARLERMLNARQALRRRMDGCQFAWACRSLDGGNMFLVQAVYNDQDSWREAAEKVATELDPRDGGIESLLSGPPLIGIFEISAKDLPSA